MLLIMKGVFGVLGVGVWLIMKGVCGLLGGVAD